MKALSKEDQAAITPAKAIELLKDGNQRFINNLQKDRELLEQVKDTASGQHPFACILSCIDSRVPAELVFDQGVGDIFSCRVAGNIVNDDILGSMEFACKVAGSKLIMVLGHSQCGAVKGACDHVEMGNLTTLLSKLEPAIQAEDTITEDRSSGNAEFVEKVSKLNVKLTMKQIVHKSPILAEMLNNGDIALKGGMYQVENGRVDFYEV